MSPPPPSAAPGPASGRVNRRHRRLAPPPPHDCTATLPAVAPTTRRLRCRHHRSATPQPLVRDRRTVVARRPRVSARRKRPCRPRLGWYQASRAANQGTTGTRRSRGVAAAGAAASRVQRGVDATPWTNPPAPWRAQDNEGASDHRGDEKTPFYFRWSCAAVNFTTVFPLNDETSTAIKSDGVLALAEFLKRSRGKTTTSAPTLKAELVRSQ